MVISAGTRLGPYEILAPLGAGGMGEVYSANDTRLNRKVAIKVLSSQVSHDPQLKERFEREARAISSLSHPHICTLYDIGSQDDVDYLVMELIEGETLLSRLKKGSLPLAQVLECGIQIAEALEKAHQQGIIHRDLKPGNIMLTRSGVKLLDFGLAKLDQRGASGFSTPNMETVEDSLTQAGVIVGTLQYMSPEQLQGKTVDSRTDLFSLGAVLYEMASGKRPFEGENGAALIAAILSTEPASIREIRASVPGSLNRLVMKCLAKDVQERWSSAHDLASELRWIAEGDAAVTTASAASRSGRERWAWSIAGALLVILIAVISASLLHTNKTPDLQQFSILLPDKVTLDPWGSLAVSPDGARVAFVAGSPQGASSVWIRSLDSLNTVPLPGTENAIYPSWSPDGRFILFFANGKLIKIPVTGGTPQALCDTQEGRGASWSKDGVILFGQGSTQGLFRVSSAGGDLTPVTNRDLSRLEDTHRWPCFLPDGRHFLFLVRSRQKEYSGIYVASLDSKEKVRLLPDETRIEYDPSGYVLFLRSGNLMAQPFDSTTLKLTGDALPIAQKVKYEGYRAYGSFSVSNNGVLVYSASLRSQLVWWDRTGKEIGTVGEVSMMATPSFSPDEKKVLVEREDPITGTLDLWMVELSRGTFSRFTFDPAIDMRSSWSPDGKRVVFASTRDGPFKVFEKPSAGGTEQLLIDSKSMVFADDWSKDGRYILYENGGSSKTKSDIWILPMFGDGKAFPYVATEFTEIHGRFSPNGKWIAYVSDESGRPEVYVSTFPKAIEGRWQISTAGGDHPQWRSDRKELYFLAPDKSLMVTEVGPGPAFESSVPVSILRAPVLPHLFPGERNLYLVTSDGSRFLFNKVESNVVPVTIVLNWRALLTK